MKPASSKARFLLKKLQALAERGIDGEKFAAQHKIARLKARYDFGAPDPTDALDLFRGSFKPSATARHIYTFAGNELDVASSVKWAIESATKIPCVFRDAALLAEATPGTAKKLTEIAVHIAHSFRALLDKFSAVGGVSTNDRGVFVMGLYDGMMNEVRNVGQRLPGGARVLKKRKAKKKGEANGAAHAPGLHVHPYTVALSLGKQIRFSTPLEQITAELEEVTKKHLTQETASS